MVEPQQAINHHLTTITSDNADLLTVEEAARRLRIGRTQMYILISTGEIETVTIGRLRRVPPECIAAYVADLRSARHIEPASA